MGFQLHRPDSVGAAIALARELGPEARYLAGGTDLIIQINRKRCAPGPLIALDRIAGLSGVAAGDGVIAIEAMTTLKTIERHPAFAGPLGALAEAARVVGGHQIRNVATIGGNIVNASPAADLVPVLLALDAEVELAGPAGARRLPLGHFLRGPGVTAREPGEVLLRVAFARSPAQTATAFIKAGRRRAMEISLVCIAAFLALDGEDRCLEARIALGAVGPTAWRATRAEELLRGGEASMAAFRAAGAAAAADCAPIDDVRASVEYRRRLVAALVPRALQHCRQRIAGGR
ncbi:MAG TPA: xanthine dehydrogenase family protein subunit M [Stellaceae bacterium]|nr:xanthine dehydrogenase family protein subunit M [Stellaceae bacterium]